MLGALTSLPLTLTRALYASASIVLTIGAVLAVGQVTLDSELQSAEARLNRELDAQRDALRNRQRLDFELTNTLHANKRTSDLQYYTLLRRITEVDLLLLSDQLDAHPYNKQLRRREANLLKALEETHRAIEELASDIALW